MSWINSTFNWLVTTASISLVVLAIGSLLTLCWARPIERLRCIQATIVAVMAACLLQQMHLLPQVSLGWMSKFDSNSVGAAANVGSAADPTNVAVNDTSRVMSARLSDGYGEIDDVAKSTVHSAGSEALSATIVANPSHPTELQASSSLSAIMANWIPTAVVIAFFSGAAWSLFSIGLAILSLCKLHRNCSAAPEEIVGLMHNISAPAERRFTVLLSSEVDVPLTFGIRRPIVVLPSSMASPAQQSILRDCLAHEWSHICRRDIAQWWILHALQPLFWYQPLYWLLRRELRLCQDQVADHFAAGRASDSLSYAEILLELAKTRHRFRSNLALTMNDGRSNLCRRIQLLVSANHHLASACRSWTVWTAAAVLVVVTIALGTVNFGRADTPVARAEKVEPASPQPAAVSLDSTPPANDNMKAESKAMSAEAVQKPPIAAGKQPATDPSVMGEELPDGSLRYSGIMVDKTTKQPIRGAQVTVRRLISASYERRTLEETKHTTDENGKYSFVIPPAQLAERLLYIELDVDHPDYATKAGFGYALSMILKNAELGDPPFYARVELDPSDSLTGRLIGPEGQPLKDVPIEAYSKTNPQDFSGDNYGSFFNTKSGDDGSFRLKLTKGGLGVFWIVPEKFAPKQIVSGTKRGDLGDVQLESGVEIKGQVVDAIGKPMPGVWVNLTDEKSQSEIQMPVASQLRRSGQTDVEGRFEIGPMKPGQFRLEVENHPSEIRYRTRERKQADLPAVFPRRKITIGPTAADPILVRAVPHVQFEGQYVDSKGKHRGGWEQFVSGKLDGETYFGYLRPDADGRIQGMLPHGLEDAQLQLTSNEHGALRIRLGEGKPLIHGRTIPLGTVEADITHVEIIKYTAPIVQLKATDEEGKPIANVKMAAIYEGEDKDKLVFPVGGMPTSIFFEKQPGGIFRTSQLLPDEKTKFVASAEGYEDAQDTLSLPEGETRELTLVLKRSAAAGDGKAAPTEKIEKPEK